MGKDTTEERMRKPTVQAVAVQEDAPAERKPGGQPWTDEMKQAQSERMKAAMSPEVRQKISEALKGRKTGPMSEATKEKLRQANLGRTMSDETKAKLRQAMLARHAATKVEEPETIEHDISPEGGNQ